MAAYVLILSLSLSSSLTTYIKIDSLLRTEAGTLNGKPYILCRRYFFSKEQFFDSLTEV